MTEHILQNSLTHRARLSEIWRSYCNHKAALVGTAVLLLITMLVTFGPLIWPLSPTELDMRARNQGPSMAHPLGTDQLGRDLLAALLHGGRVSLLVGITAMALSLIIGTVIGGAAGYFKRADGVLMRLTDLFLALPLLPLLLLVIMLWRDALRSMFGPEGGIFLLLVAVIGLTSWMQTARILRGEVLALKEREFILAARALGTPDTQILIRHVLPNVASPIVVSATLGLANAILTESALSFLGLGFASDTPSWGRLLFDGTQYMTLAPARVIWPGLAISLTVLSVNYIGDGLRDALDPRATRLR